jgi:glycosyltransferase involved in cell wall biosynthesis
MSPPRFSIVIPTCDRANLLAATIPSCLLCPYPNLEVVVSDNYSSPETAAVVSKFLNDSRVRYVRTSARLSMPDHWDFAWRHATGDYIIMNGDDDAIAPSLPQKLREVSSSLNAALMSWHVGLYVHPDWDNPDEVNSYTFLSGHSRALIDVDPLSVFASYAKLDITTLFPQGTRICFSARLAERAVERFGKLFWGPYPDFSAPLILLGLLRHERYVYIDELLGYGGRSKLSNAAAIDKDAGNEKNQDRMRSFYSEFKDDIYPNQPIKVRSLWNGHGETVNLVRKLLPDVFGSYSLDISALIAGIECEFRGINVFNAHMGQDARSEFDAFVASQDSAVVEAAMRIVNRASILSAPERWYSHRPGRVQQALRLMRKLETAMRLVRSARYDPDALKRLEARLTARRNERQFPANGVATNQQVRTLYSGRMIRIKCIDLGCRDGAELTAKLDEISTRFDPVTWGSVADFAAGGALRAAYASAAAAYPPSMSSSSVEGGRPAAVGS